MSSAATEATVAVTGANGFVGYTVCEVLAQRGVPVRAIVRRAGTAPEGPGIEELVGDFTDSAFAAEIVSGAHSVVTTVHPMRSDRATQHRIGVEGTTMLARAAASADAQRFIHVSTAAVYDRSPGVGDVDESSALVADSADDYAVTKRDADLELGRVDGITRVLLRPPAILGAGETSTWNTIRPAAMRDNESARHAVADASFAWVHVDDLASLIAELADGRGRMPDVAPGAGSVTDGPVAGECVALNVAAARAVQRDYVEAVTAALGLDPIWDEQPAWTGRISSERAHGWGWRETVDLRQALAEIAAGLS